MPNQTDPHPLMQYDGCINTYTGIKFNLLDPKPEMVVIEDIASGLAYKGHFGGQTPLFFSIADHSILVFDLLNRQSNIHLSLAALLHDASEAYIGDMIKPLKIHLPFFCEVENKIQQAIFQRFNLDIELMKEIKPFDIEAQKIEYEAFYKHNESYLLSYRSPGHSYSAFLSRAMFFLNKLHKQSTLQ